MRSFLPSLASLALLVNLATAAETGAVGSTVAGFTLKNTAGKAVSLSDFKDKKAIAVVFIGTQCPISNAYLFPLAGLHREFDSKGVQFLAINSNSQDNSQKVIDHAREHKIPFPVLKDIGNVVADKFGAKRTPEVFLLSNTGKILYRGRIDDQHGYNYRREAPTRRDLALAIEEVLAGKKVSVASTPVEGCFIGRLAKTKDDGAITYAKHVAPIIQKRCLECHRPTQIGPMSLETYQDLVDWSDTIREVVLEKRMPPWHADPRHGKFSNARALSKQEIETLIGWINNGMPRSQERDLPKPVKFAEGWMLGKPDVVFEFGSEQRIPAKSEQKSLRYQYVMVRTNFKEDRWVQAAEARPGNREVVHHIIVYVLALGQRLNESREDGIGSGFLTAYAPGDMPSVFPAGTAKKIPRGATLVFQMHYTPTNTAQTDRSSVGLIFAKEPPKHEARTRAIASRRLNIPPGEENHKVVAVSEMRRDARLLSLMPHMHLRGKSFRYRVIFPDGKEQILLDVPRYDFAWQTVYRLEKPLDLPAGTKIECTAVFDNSAKNRNNPDPTKWVRWGEQTWDEMMIGFLDYVYLDKK